MVMAGGVARGESHLLLVGDPAFDKEVKSQACVFPKQEIWPPNFALNKLSPSKNCSQNQESWFYSTNGIFKISETIKATHEDIKCSFTPFVRRSDTSVGPGERIENLKDGDPMPADFGKVMCIDKSSNKYKNIVSGIHYKNDIMERKTNFTGKSNPSKIDILMFGFDSMSRMSWLRQLPKTHSHFTKKMGGIVMEGYNIVGDGTPQALLPILTGHTETELPEARKSFEGSNYLDGHPWIWKDLKRMGYVTQMGEDRQEVGTWTYRMLGFQNQPTDHDMRTLYLTEEMKRDWKSYCLSTLSHLQNMLNWITDFFTVYRSHPKFSFLFHVAYTHDQSYSLDAVDDDLVAWLSDMETGGYLDNSLIILMSDHGSRFSEVRQHNQGKFEERNPYFAFRFPPKFQKQYPYLMLNLKRNARRLVTPFDVHATFEDLIDMDIYGDRLKGRVTDRGISVLREIPMERTCEDADIEPHWCTCLDMKAANISSQIVQRASTELIRAINTMIMPESHLCEHLNIHHVMNASTFSPSIMMMRFKGNKDRHGRVPDFSDTVELTDLLVRITVETIPGGALFEATLKHDTIKDKFEASGTAISRINKYGDAPHCVQDRLPHLRPYCYCKEQKNSITN